MNAKNRKRVGCIMTQPDHPVLDSHRSIVADYFAVIGAVDELVANPQLVSNPALNISHNTISERLERPTLPVIKLPSFNGNHLEWLPFKKKFVALVHSLPSVSIMIKYMHLENALSDSALGKLADFFYTSDENYSKAWAALCKAYDQERLLKNVHIDALLDLPRLSKADPDNLSALIDSARLHLNLLEQVYEKVNEVVVVRILERCLPPSVSAKWQDRLDVNRSPTLDELSRFIQNTVVILCSLDKAAVSDYRNARKRPSGKVGQDSLAKVSKSGARALATTASERFACTESSNSSKNVCLKCSGGHRLVRCPKFNKLKTQERYDFVKSSWLCYNCLCKHALPCRNRERCRLCKGKHQTLVPLEKTFKSEVSHQRDSNASHADFVPNETFPRHLFRIPNNLKLADLQFHVPKTVGILLVSRTTLSILVIEQGRIQNGDSEIILQKTALGWVVAVGTVHVSGSVKTVCNVVKLDKLIERFWIIEDFDHEPVRSRDDVVCEEHFVKHTSRDASGRWQALAEQLSVLREFSMNRQILGDGLIEAELHGFCDASAHGYGACLFIRTVSKTGKVSARLICSKSRVAPLSGVTIPRLELCAALVLKKLFVKVKAQLEVPIKRVVFWSESTIVLCWLNEAPHLLKTLDLTGSLKFKNWVIKSNGDVSVLRITQQTPCLMGNFQWISLTIRCGVQRCVRVVALMLRWRLPTVRKEPSNSFSHISDAGTRLSQIIARERPLLCRELVAAERRIIVMVQRERFQNEVELLATARDTRSGEITAPFRKVTRLDEVNPFLDKHNIIRCVECIRQRPKAVNARMADLPESRVTEAPAFFHSDVDFFDPILIKEKKDRNRCFIKTYRCVFVCLASKAVHIEQATDLSSEGFLAAFHRFISRRGIPSHVYSDNGTHFVGANKELSEIYKMHGSPDFINSIKSFALTKRIKWHFTSPLSPHFGGLWEAAINTLLIEIEAVLNSRPLYSLSADPNDLLAITPAHLLNGRPVNFLPGENLVSVPANQLTTYGFITKARQDFWNKWHKEYLHELQTRQKWRNLTGQLIIGAIVILMEDSIGCARWPLGVIAEKFPGDDGVARVATIKTASGVYK
ncbi:hypothetical protein KM043_014444 [Ampulex compressa]|nr:hypothetical protein KM043_014444 [Ampulex compressa]